MTTDHTHTHGPESYSYTGANGCGFYVAVCGIRGLDAPESAGWCAP